MAPKFWLDHQLYSIPPLWHQILGFKWRSVPIGGPRLFLKVAICKGNTWPESWEDCANPERWGVHSGYTTQKLHSDQGRNLKGRILGDLCKAFGIKKSHTTPYHPMGDSLVKRMNRSLLTLTRSQVERDNQWEEHLHLLLLCTGPPDMPLLDFLLMRFLFGSNPPSQWLPNLQDTVLVDQSVYRQKLRRKLLQ